MQHLATRTWSSAFAERMCDSTLSSLVMFVHHNLLHMVHKWANAESRLYKNVIERKR